MLYIKVIKNRVTTYFDTLNLFSDFQNGFRKKRSCEDHAYVLSTILRVLSGKSTYVSFIDFEKAFDWIPRDFLLYKLLSYNVVGIFYNAIKSMYSNTTSSLKLNNIFTKWFDTTTGVRQRDTLSPTLFNIFLDDLITDLEQFPGIETDDFSLSVLCFADDIVIFCDREEKLQSMLNHVADWCSKWCLKVNGNESKVLHVRPKRLVRTEKDFVLGNKLLNVVYDYKYLGFYFDEFMDLNKCIIILSDATGRSLGEVISKFKSLRDFTHIPSYLTAVWFRSVIIFWNLGFYKKLGDKYSSE